MPGFRFVNGQGLQTCENMPPELQDIEIEGRMFFPVLRKLPCRPALVSLSLALAQGLAPSAFAEATAFTQSLAASAATDEAVAAWYRQTAYDTLWTGEDDAVRREAFFAAISTARDHGLPVVRYDVATLMRDLRAAETEGDRGRVEVEMTRAYLAWAHDLTSGALTPKDVDGGILREINVIDPQILLTRIANGDPQAVLDWLEPKSVQYLQLMKAKLGLEAQIAAGGWGETVAAASLAPGDTGPAVIALRDRLVRMGYLAPTAVAGYDRTLQAAVTSFQLGHGLTPDGAAGEGTVAEINIG
ncbi:MAG: hypothetical protein EON48_12755, partial [Acetobacteraceae bacterium]